MQRQSGDAEPCLGISRFGKSGEPEPRRLLLHLEDRHGFRRAESVEMTFCVRQLPVRVQASIRQLYPGYVVGVAFTMLSERGKRQLTTLIDELDEILHGQVESLLEHQKSIRDRS